MEYWKEITSTGLFMPAFLIVAGFAMWLHAPHRRSVPPDSLARAHPFVKYLATRNWERQGGAFIAAGGALIMFLRLM